MTPSDTGLVFREEAVAEFKAARAWYAERSEATADRFTEALRDALEKIAANPEMFARDEVDPRFQYILVDRFPFRVVYRVRPSEIEVLAIAHTSRLPGFWSERTEPSKR